MAGIAAARQSGMTRLAREGLPRAEAHAAPATPWGRHALGRGLRSRERRFKKPGFMGDCPARSRKHTVP